MRKAPSLRGLSPQATGEFAPKRKKAPKGFPGEGKLFGEEGKRKLIKSFMEQPKSAF